MKKKTLPKIMNLLLDTVFAVDEDGYFVYASASCEDLLGYTPDELLGKNVTDLVHPDDLESTLFTAMHVRKGQPALHFENRYIHKDGHSVDIMWSARWSTADRLRLAVARNMTAVKQAKRLQAAIYRISEAGQTALELPSLCVIIHEIINDLLPIRNFSVILYDQKQKAFSIPYRVGDDAHVAELLSAAHPQILHADSPITRIIVSGESLLTTVPTQRDSHLSDATHSWLGVPLVSSGQVIGALVINNSAHTPDFTPQDQELLQYISTQIAATIERKQVETHLRHLAVHDPLTDLPNRLLFQDRVEVALNRAQRDSEHLALLYLDLNQFKQINDRFGHDVGDQLLVAVAARLVGCLRKSDTVSRMGGDEFTVLLVNVQEPSCVTNVIQKIRHALSQPFELLTQNLSISASIGSAFYPEDGHEYIPLLRHADLQMYNDKQRQKIAPIKPS